MSKWFLGSVDPITGKASRDAWKKLGYDLDGRVTTDEDSVTGHGTCKRRAGAGPKVLADGELGRDDNFGQHFVSTLRSMRSDFEEVVNGRLAAGETTLLLRLDNVGPNDNGNVPGALYVAGGFGGAASPTFTTADAWPMDASSVDGGGAAKLQFPNGYMLRGVWISGDPGVGSFALPIPGFTNGAAIPLSAAVITLALGTGEGVIAGASDPAALGTAMAAALASLGMCPATSTSDTLSAALSLSVDLVAGAPSLQDESRDCDALSVGLGFLARPTGEPSKVVPAALPVTGECP